MGREAHILLAILGLLAGAFVGVLSIKLLSPRPPAGAGADIHDDVAMATPAALVEPPALAPSRGREPVADQPAVPAGDRYATKASGFARSPAADDVIDTETAPAASQEPMRAARDPFAARGLGEPQPLDPSSIDAAVPIDRALPTGAATVAPRSEPPRSVATDAGLASPPVTAATHLAPRHDVTLHVAAAGDSWWSLAERIYGDGRVYRALFAWNRAINPRVSLVPGTPLELPPRSKLAMAWPDLMPRE